MKVIGKDRTSCDVCNPIDEILARLDALERRASAIVAKVQRITPDGEGNVTLPTSSSDSDPLHGRVDAFAMSSEVKEAADDAHAYAASIADDVIVINSEIAALTQAVAALQPAEIEAIKSAVQTLQTTVATLESTVTALDNDIVGKVSKSGDTMTGMLTSEYSYIPFRIRHTGLEKDTILEYISDIQLVDKNNIEMGTMRFGETSTGIGYIDLIARNYQGTASHCKFHVETDGSSYLWTPSWSVGTNDNSDKIMTIKMANSLPSLVHTTGNETIAGDKTFSGLLQISNAISFKGNDTYPDFRIRRSGTKSVNLSLFIGGDATKAAITVNSSGNSIAIGSDSVKAYASATPSGATGNEIATADWVITKINDLATKNGLIGL